MRVMARRRIEAGGTAATRPLAARTSAPRRRESLGEALRAAVVTLAAVAAWWATLLLVFG